MMNTIETIRRTLTLTYDWIKPLADDLADAPLTSPTGNGGNHPHWIMGHLVFSKSGLLAMISGRDNPLQSWKELFSGGTSPVSDGSGYPDYESVLATFEKTHQGCLNLLVEIGESRLEDKPVNVWEMVADDPDFQSNAKLFLFIAMHEMSHRGQLADARRVLGRKPFA